MDFLLERASVADLDQVMGLEDEGFPPGIRESRAVFERRIRAFPEGFLLARPAGQAAMGYLCAEIWKDWDLQNESRFDLGHDIGTWLDPRGHTLYVASMTVAASYRGGTGRALFRRSLERLADDFPQLTSAVLIVNEHWTAARRIYGDDGFVETARLPAFFRPEGGPLGDALVMTRRFPAEA